MTTDLRIEYRDLDGLKPYGRNARTHSPTQLDTIKRSLVANGWTTPMGVADGTLVYGHARRLAAIALRAEGKEIRRNADPNKGPVVDLSHLSAPERRAYVIADNRTAELAGWDPALLRMEMGAMFGEGFDIDSTGFAMPDMAKMFRQSTKERDGKSQLASALGYQVVVDCTDEAHQADVIKMLRKMKIKCRPLIL